MNLIHRKEIDQTKKRHLTMEQMDTNTTLTIVSAKRIRVKENNLDKL